MRCDAKRSLSLNFFLIDFSRANLGMHWHQARPEAPLPRCPDAPMHMSIVRRIACLVAAVHSFPLHFSKTVCLPKFMCIFHCFLFSSSLHFCIFFCNFFWKCPTCHSTNSLAYVPPVPSLPVPPSPSAQHLHTYIPFVVFHVIPLAIRHFSSCTLLNYLCFLNAIFYVAPFWFVSPCRVFFTCRISCSRLLFATCHTCFLVFFSPLLSLFFSQFDVASFTFNSFKLFKVILAVVELLA